MQIETTTVTTETQIVFGENFIINTVEQNASTVCDCCPNQAVGAKEMLQNRGWSLNGDSQFCPECNY